MDVLLAGVVQIVVVELVLALEVDPVTRPKHVDVETRACIIGTRRLKALGIRKGWIKAKHLKDACPFLTLVQEVAQEVEIGLLTFHQLTLLDIVDQDVQDLQACLRKIELVATGGSSSFLKLILLGGSWWSKASSSSFGCWHCCWI